MKKAVRPKSSFLNLRILCAAALLAALSAVLGKYLQVPSGDSIRLSLENLPILMAGIFFGPLVGGMVGVTADLLGCLMVGYTVNPIIAVGATLIGVLSGIIARIATRHDRPLTAGSIYLAVAVAHTVGSMTVKTIGLAVYYSTPTEVLLWRIPIYIAIGALEGSVILLLARNRIFMGELERLRHHRQKRGNGHDL